MHSWNSINKIRMSGRETKRDSWVAFYQINIYSDIAGWRRLWTLKLCTWRKTLGSQKRMRDKGVAVKRFKTKKNLKWVQVDWVSQIPWKWKSLGGPKRQKIETSFTFSFFSASFSSGKWAWQYLYHLLLHKWLAIHLPILAAWLELILRKCAISWRSYGYRVHRCCCCWRLIFTACCRHAHDTVLSVKIYEYYFTVDN